MVESARETLRARVAMTRLLLLCCAVSSLGCVARCGAPKEALNGSSGVASRANQKLFVSVP